jgi:hypothetical protein
MLEHELEELLNRHSAENESNTPDFLLARYLMSCLEAFNKVVKDRDRWYGVVLEPGNSRFISDEVSY